MTIAIRIRKMITGCGTLLPTASTTSRTRCVNDLGALEVTAPRQMGIDIRVSSGEGPISARAGRLHNPV